MKINSNSSFDLQMKKNASEVVTTVREAFETGITKPYEYRLKQIKALLRLLDENEDELCKAVIDDTRKPMFEAVIYEVEYVKNSLKDTIFKLKEWMEPIRPAKPLPLLFDKVL